MKTRDRREGKEWKEIDRKKGEDEAGKKWIFVYIGCRHLFTPESIE
jgi:hypothetical protein